MGRLTLNVLLSFAQFEREVTAERIRDKIAASKARGMWMGGTVPIGYRVEHRKLVPVPEEAALVRRIFERYLALGSVSRLKAELHEVAACSYPIRGRRSTQRIPSDDRELLDLLHLGPATKRYPHELGIGTVSELADQDADELYVRLQRQYGVAFDPCLHDVFVAVIAEARTGERHPLARLFLCQEGPTESGRLQPSRTKAELADGKPTK